MGILNVNKIQPVGVGQTVTISATNINAGSATVTAGTFSGGVAVTSGNLTGITSVSTTSVSTTNLKVDTIQDQAGGNASTPDEIYSGRAKAWVNFNGQGTVAIRADFNVSSITDNGTGDYTIIFTSALPDANYATFGSVGDLLNTTPPGSGINDDKVFFPQFQSTSSVRVYSQHPGPNTVQDPLAMYVAIFR